MERTLPSHGLFPDVPSGTTVESDAEPHGCRLVARAHVPVNPVSSERWFAD